MTRISEEDLERIMTPGSQKVTKEEAVSALRDGGDVRVYGVPDTHEELSVTGICRAHLPEQVEGLEFLWIGSSSIPIRRA